MIDDNVAALANRKARRIARKRNFDRIGYTGAAATLAAQVQAAENAEGSVIAHSLAEALSQRTRLQVRQDVHVPLSRETLILAAAANGTDPNAELRCLDNGTRSQVDVLTYDPWYQEVTCYEVKRGSAPIGANHRRLRELEHLALRITGGSFVEQLIGEPVVELSTRVISFYGRTGFDSEVTVTGGELDRYFGVPVCSEISTHVAFFRYQLDRLIPGLTGAVYPPLTVHATGSQAAETAEVLTAAP